MKQSVRIKRLGDLFSFKNGRAFKKEEWSPAGLPIIRIQNLNNEEAAFNHFAGDFSQEILIEPGDLLFSWSGTIGSSFGSHIWLREPGVLNQHIFKVRHGEEINKRYAFYALRYITDEIEKQVSGAVGLVHITKERLNEFKIPVPELEKQQRIVGILDEAFAGIATAKANAESNLRNAEGIRTEFLRSMFDHRGAALQADLDERDPARGWNLGKIPDAGAGTTRTGGRAAALRHIPGELSLSVGMPARGARTGWRWIELAKLARLESGHTPSRRHPEYWGGDIRWLSIRDARDHHGGYVSETIEQTNELGIANSSARVLPIGTVCLSRTASVGYVTVTKKPLATSQDFVSWVCSPQLNPDFLKYIFLAEGREGLLRFASGAVHQTIYFPEAKAFHVCCPDRLEQDQIVAQCDAVTAESALLVDVYQRKLTALDELKQSHLHQAFSGQL